MSTFKYAQRAVRASAPLLRSSPAITNRGSQRLFHESSKAKAVEAIATQTLLNNGPPPPPNMAQLLQQPQQLLAEPFPQPEGYTQLNVREQAYNPRFYETIGKIMKLREKYLRDRSIFVESADMIDIVLGLGAKEADLPKMEKVSDHLYHDPTLPFRLTRNSRFCLDFDTHTIRRLEFQPFVLTVEEDFNRYDSGAIRRFDEVENELQLNSVFQALFAFKAMIIHGIEIAHRPKLEYGINKWVCTLFNLRTVTTPHILGEPALEGVHSDGVDHTMTTFLGSYNMSDNSAATFMHDMDEKTGIPLEEIKPKHLLARVQHKRLLDTLVIVDHERKHSLSAVYPVDETKEAHRDMLVFFTRKPVERTHVSGSIDSLTPHKELPMEVPLYLPGSNQ